MLLVTTPTTAKVPIFETTVFVISNEPVGELCIGGEEKSSASCFK